MINSSLRMWSGFAGLVLVLLLTAPLTARAEFYDQPPMTEAELVKFIEDMPLYLKWARQNREQAHPSLDEQGRPSFVYSSKAAAQAEALGWKAERFFCVMGRAAAALALDGKSTRDKPVDMPMISPGEQRLVRRYAGALDALE